ncbi:hypothetical protein [Streptomyces leeuwenhoekii]|uniref:Sle1_063 protein n=1 Tax=Streptomyces leeuwenhoekii TaxID=1437453 RepID=A0A0F7VL10_STRLW|nr:hypothetical protein [Streptomyces leeuwenhoekii]CQR59230.1 sle1_063 [Streptomyces leeuwenhoekii]
MTMHVEAILNIPLDNGRTMPTRMGIAAEPTTTDGLVVFPKLLDLFDYDDSVWHVTHAPTGRYLPIDFPTEEQAAGFAGAIGGLADWASLAPVVDVPALVAVASEYDGAVHQRVLDALGRRAV